MFLIGYCSFNDSVNNSVKSSLCSLAIKSGKATLQKKSHFLFKIISHQLKHSNLTALSY
uniref:Uncharacterized protein n=1 Tax=Anguilla anguilla TaxID=7936 RepID=A0A0E9XJL3_ANGAN